jgi:amino acid adenylation domain-containing protein
MKPRSDDEIACANEMTPGNAFVPFAREEIQQSIPSRFEQVVARYPERLAVKKNGLGLSFEALNQTANRIARTILCESGADNEPVAVLVENDAMTIAAILGVLKAGKIYVPLDSSFPVAWSKFILEDTQARTILARQKSLCTEMTWLNSGHRALNIDSLDSNFSAENLGVDVSPDALAHILYTSGSTAHPKGVMDTHRNTLHYVMRLTNASAISADDRATLVRPPSSSGALMNLYLALLNGASLFPIDIKEAGVHSLADWLRRERITIFHAGGTVFRHFAQQLTVRERFSDLRLIRLSSGQIFKSDVDLFKRNFPESLLLHVLSSTEANTYRVHFLGHNSEVSDGAVPVGYAVEDMEVLILDDTGNELEINNVGEIALRSAYLFPGYWNNPELTQAAFLPYHDAQGRRVFRTGDLGRLRQDGCLEYLGRKDFRLKIRGHSIQAEEVELALLKIPGIIQAAVAARKDSNGDDRLLAFIATNLPQAPRVDRLRELLKESLPDYMIPTTFVNLTALPILSNGKVNRQALPSAPKTRPALSVSYAEPRTPIEAAVAKIWCDAMGVESLGIEDNFFDLGGDSLIASKIVAHLNRMFSSSLALGEFFGEPTIKKIATLLVSQEPNPERTDKIARVFLRIESMSAAEISQAVSDARLKRFSS